MPLLIFDLDGTLIDSSRDLAVSTNAMLRHLGRPEVDGKTVNSFVGDGAPTLVRRALGGDPGDEEFHAAYHYFISYYRSHSLEHTRLYDGIGSALDELKSLGHTMAVLTNKPVKISRDILAGLRVDGYFHAIHGGDSLPAKKPDPIGIRTIMQQAGHTASETIMVGDSNVDTKTARAAGVLACGVSWGFRPETLNDPPVDFLAARASDLPQVLRIPAA